MTFAELKAAIEKITPEQLGTQVYWSGDDRGGAIEALDVTDEDTILDEDTGEFWPRSMFEDEFGSDVSGWPAHRIVGQKGTPVLFTDGVS